MKAALNQLLIDKLEFRNYGYVRAENFLPLQTYNS
jgi:hypothetical protein